MPTYRYECPNGHTLEDFEPMTAPTERPCPECFDSCPVHGDAGTCDLVANPECGGTLVYMKRVIGTGGGVIWKNGPPTRRFHK